jgi:eukaryotic-like serine/threonine-protein kinase
MDLIPGARIGQYELDARLGAGGMGEVYRARDDRLRRFVALKFLPPGYEHDADARRRQQAEARAAAALDHPYICKIYEVGEADGRTFIAMECVSGATLAARLSAGPLPLVQALPLAIEMADALSAAHRGGVIHRDLKPSNVMIGDDGHVKILDFGIASRMASAGDSATPTITSPATDATTKGTLAYMAPEQLRDEPADARSDVFAFGIVLYEMLAGAHPFGGVTSIETASAILQQTPRPWPSPAPALLQHIVRKALAKSPADRYQSMHEVLTDLRAVAADTAGVALSRAGTGGAGAGGARTLRRRMAALGTVAAMVIGGGALVGWWLSRERTTTAPSAATHRQVTLVGDVTSAALAPDGRTVAFASAGDGSGSRIHVQDVAGGPTIEVARGNSLHVVGWVPDGSHLAYHVPGGETFLVSRFGGAARPFVRGYWLAWSPDGSMVAAVAPMSRGFSTVDRQGTVASTVKMDLGHITGLDWHRASNRIAISGRNDQDRSEVWIAAPDGTGLRRVFSEESDLHLGRWSPTASVLYCVRLLGPTSELVALDIEDGRDAVARVLASGLPLGHGLTVSADGRSLLLVRATEFSNLSLIDLERPGAPARALTRGTGHFSLPSVSPDGKWVLTSMSVSDESRIVKVPLAGGDPVPLTTGTSNDRSPVWSADGSQIIFASTRDGAPGLWAMTSTGQQVTKLDAGPVGANLLVATTPEGGIAWQQMTSGKYMNYRIRDLATGAEEYLVAESEAGWVFRPVFSRNGDKVAVFWNRGKGQRGLWVLTWPGRAGRMLRDNAHPIGWSPDGEWVMAFDEDRRADLLAISATTGESRVLATLPAGDFNASGSGLGYATPDGKSLVVVIEERRSDAWLIENFDPRVTR